MANDETSQFIGASFVNNPSIGFPDYTLGAGFHHQASGAGPGFTLLLAGSHGLGDNPNASYPQLVDVTESGKGVFAAAEVYGLTAPLTWRLGAWTNTADHARLDGTGNGTRQRGIYGVLDGHAGRGAWNLRAGLADATASETARFLAASMRHPVGPASLGLGIAHAWASADLGLGSADTSQAEVYVRFPVSDKLALTPSLQYISNSGLSGGAVPDADAWVMGLRLGYTF